VLVVDDNIANQEVLRAFVERSCKVVECAASAREGLECLAREAFDVALIDLEMPEESGDVVVRRMAELGAGTPSSGCVLVAVSAHTRDEKRTECIALGFQDFLPKPVDRHELFQMLQRIAASRSAPGTK
jgi:CheY-like chemotaxis protein